MKIIDADGSILGRLASEVATLLLSGEEIIIINAEKARITGGKRDVLKRYKEKRARGSKEKGPYFPRRPDLVLKRTVRGMLSYRRGRGREAFSRLKVFIGIPPEYKKGEKIKEAIIEREKYVELGEICKELGWKDESG
jgi:large subunit ribosomal protein L13